MTASEQACFRVIDDYARKRHLCFLAEMFLDKHQTEYVLCFRPTEAANDPDRYAGRYLRLETSAIERLKQDKEPSYAVKALLDKELVNFNLRS